MIGGDYGLYRFCDAVREVEKGKCVCVCVCVECVCVECVCVCVCSKGHFIAGTSDTLNKGPV